VKGASLVAVILAIVLGISGAAAGQTLQPSPPPLGMSRLMGGVPAGQATADIMTVTVLDAIQRALERNLGVLMAEQDLGHARGARWKALSELLPNINGRVSETRQQTNLQSFGFGSFGSAFAGIPNIVGPFNVFDARVFVTQSVVDIAKINDARSETHNVDAARYSYQSTRDLVIHVAANTYILALAASARTDSARAQLQTAQTLYDQATDLKQAGIIAGVDVLRAEVQLNVERQRATIAANDFEKTKLQLARLIGLPVGQRFALDANLPEVPAVDMSLEEAVQRAYEARSDYQAALERVRAAEASRQSIVGELLPSVHVNGDFGDIGLSPSDSHSTFSVTGAVSIPIFQGGRTRGRLMQADADLRSRRSEAEDLKAGIYYDVQIAFLDLESTSQQLQVATKARDLAAQQLTQTRDRFAAGVASNVEVVQAQESVALANEQFISAQYGYALAKGALIRGIGTPEQALRQILGGTR
jgi:outer membrane protein TolC